MAKTSKAVIETRKQRIHDIVAGSDGPQSVRHIFYRATDPREPGAVEKTDSGYRAIARLVAEMRRSGEIGFHAVADSSRRAHWNRGYRSISDFAHSVAQFYRKALWHEKGVLVEAWVESRSLEGVVERVCRDYQVPLFPAGGFASITFIHEAAEHIAAAGKDALILYAGDYDPAGVLIDAAIERDMRGFLRELGYRGQFDFLRLAVTPEQIVEMDLPTKPRKESDKRSRHIETAVEAESIRADVMRRLFADAFDTLIDPQERAALEVAEHSERRAFTEAAKGADVAAAAEIHYRSIERASTAGFIQRHWDSHAAGLCNGIQALGYSESCWFCAQGFPWGQDFPRDADGEVKITMG